MVSDVHPQLRSSAKKILGLPLNKLTVKIIRQIAKIFPKAKIPEGITIRNVEIYDAGKSNKLRLRIYSPTYLQEKVPGMLWFHGGGLVIGNPELNDTALIQFVQELGIVIVSVDYRLAPENPYPAAIQDCYTGLEWMAENASALSVDEARISVGGESAGGGLAAALAQLAVDRGVIIPKFQFLIYPMIDDHTAVNEKHFNKKYYGWNQKNNYFGWKSYLNLEPGSESIPEYAAASRREDVSGLPPAWIFCGGMDMFYEEDALYAHRLNKAAVQCQFETMEGVYHGFDSLNSDNEFVIEFRKKQINVLRENLF